MNSARFHQNVTFYQIVRKHTGGVYARARRILADPRDAEEATQDVFLKVYKGLRGYRGEGVLEAWIYRITLNVCKSRKRRTRRREVFLEDQKAAETITCEEQSPEGLYIEEESKRMLAGLIPRLSEKESEALTLFYDDEFSYERIAEIMDIPTGSVAVILHRARARLHVHYLSLEREKVR
jgi:RNA polymerase sigma-70 factor (ECF subfamily)